MTSVIRKFCWSALTVFLATTFIFATLRLAPGDPVERILGENASPEEVTKMRSDLGLDKSFGSQYFLYFSSIFKGDLGRSLFKKKPVVQLVAEYLPPTLILSVFTIFLSSLMGVCLGMLSALNYMGSLDRNIRMVTLLGLSFPIFSLAPLLVWIFSIHFNWVPVSGWGGVLNVVLPVITVSIPLSSILARVTRTKFLEESGALWVTVLKSKGISRNGIILRILKVSMPSIFNVIAIQLSVVLAGTIITETIFDIPGIGLLLFEAIQNRDYPLVQGVILYATVVYMFVYFVTDVINEKIDPRIVQ